MRKTVISFVLVFGFLVSNAQNHFSISEKQRLDEGKFNKIHEHILDNLVYHTEQLYKKLTGSIDDHFLKYTLKAQSTFPLITAE